MNDLETKYHSVEKLIKFVVHKHIQRYGGNFDELLSEAHEHFMDASLSYDPTKGEFKKRISYKIWMSLLETVRQKSKRNKKLKENDVPIDELYQKKFDLDSLIKYISKDSAFVIGLAINPVPEMCIENQKDQYKKIKQAIVVYLREIGWEWDRIVDSFLEIRENL